jgi:hypothetical protein
MRSSLRKVDTPKKTYLPQAFVAFVARTAAYTAREPGATNA